MTIFSKYIYNIGVCEIIFIISHMYFYQSVYICVDRNEFDSIYRRPIHDHIFVIDRNR